VASPPLSTDFFENHSVLGVIAKGNNRVKDPEQKRRERVEGRKNGEAVS
jgi:hypothetical protein